MTLFTDAGESEFGGNISNLSYLVSASNLCTELYFDVEVAYGIAYWIYSQPILLKISMYYLHSILLSLTDSFIFSNAFKSGRQHACPLLSKNFYCMGISHQNRQSCLRLRNIRQHPHTLLRILHQIPRLHCPRVIPQQEQLCSLAQAPLLRG